MANELLNSPAEIVAELLIQLGVGSDPSATPAEAWPVYVDEFNDAVDEMITVQDTLGSPDGQTQVDGELMCHFGFQVLVRARHPRDGWRKADEVRQALATLEATGTNAWAGIVVIAADADGSGHAYGVLSVNQISPVIRNGREPTSARRRWSVNATATIRAYAFPPALAYYPFDGDGADGSGNGKSLSPAGDVAFVEGRIGKAVSVLNGSSYSRGNDVLTGRVTQVDYSLSAWFLPSSSNSDGSVILPANAGGVGAFIGIGNAEAYASFIDGTYETVRVAVSMDTWHHLAVVVHADGTADFYLDGSWRETLRDMTDASVFEGPPSVLFVGGGGVSDRCHVDDVVVASDALNSVEVAALYAGGVGRPYPID